jgi:acyl-CoA thioester hydrolase
MKLKDNPRFSVRVEITIPFHDTDAMGVVWHGNYFRYFEIAREALLKQFNYGYRQMQASGLCLADRRYAGEIYCACPV